MSLICSPSSSVLRKTKDQGCFLGETHFRENSPVDRRSEASGLSTETIFDWEPGVLKGLWLVFVNSAQTGVIKEEETSTEE